jgi:microtubule-associated protein-like 6
MTPEEKIGCKLYLLLLLPLSTSRVITVIFAMYDFDESSVLTLDEMILAFRSTLSGLSKLSRIDPPTEADVEAIVVQGYEICRKAESQKQNSNADDSFGGGYAGIERDAFLKFCLDTPEIMSWIEYFDDLEEYDDESRSSRPVKTATFPQHFVRHKSQFAYMNPSLGGIERLEWERKGLAKDYMPKRNWENVLPFLAPAKIVEPTRETPPHSVVLDWAYGFNAHSSRQSLYYNAKGALVYPAGSICVVFDVAQNTQSHFVGHSDLVTCLKLYHDENGKTIVASGECGNFPSVLVWDCDSKKILSSMKGFHRRCILQIDFSPDRKKIVSLGMDIYNSLAVYEWRTGVRLWGGRSTTDSVNDVRFLNNTLIASCGKDHIIFWTENASQSYTRYRGLFGSAFKPETLWTVGSVGDLVVTGSDSGMLFVWEGRNLIRGIKAHTGAVHAMYMINSAGSEQGLVTACSAGKIQVWNAKLEIGATFNANILGPIEPSIVSLCWDMVTDKILVGFRTCEIFEMDSTDGRNAHNTSVMVGHYHVKVGGLCTHPTNSKIFCSVGSDKSVRVFDASRRKQIKVALLDTMAKCCAYSPDGELIYVGLGSGEIGKEERKEGAHVVLKEDDLTIIHEARDSKSQISDIKISPNGETMALSSLDGAIYVYNTRDYAAKSKCRGHSGRVTHIDFSNDSQFLKSNCTGGDLLFWDADKGDQQAPKLMRDIEWETNTCVYSYNTQGIWGPYGDGVEILSTTTSNAGDLVASLDTCGRLRIHCNPCISDFPNCVTCYAHSANAQCIRFAVDDGLILSTGGTDGCIFQWRVSLPEVQDKEEMKRDDTVDRDQIAGEVRFEGKIIDRSPNCENVLNGRTIAQCLLEEGVVEANEMLPWQRTIVSPSSFPVENLSEPPDSLELDFISGFSCDRSRDALRYSRNSEIAFFSASIAVIMNQGTHSQRFYTEHFSSITSMAIHPTLNIIATGQQGEVPSIRVWDSKTLKTIAVLEGFHRRTINHLAFSPDGDILATVGGDRFHSIALYNWRFQHIVSFSSGFSSKSFFLGYNKPGSGLIQCGKDVIRFWEIDGLNMRYQDALFTSRSRLQEFLCATWIGSNAVVGTANGNLYRFVGRSLDGMVQAHASCVNSLSSSNDGICSGGGDGFVKLWNRSLECNLVIDVRGLGSMIANVKCVDWDSDHGIILIGTACCEIYEVSAFDGESVHKIPLMQGHSGNELWGLSVHPLKNQYCTVGDDALLRIWSTNTHNAIASLQLEMAARSCAYSPDGRKIAIGFGSPIRLSHKQYDGKWIVLDSEDLQVTHEARDSNKWITDMKYSPNGSMLAIGCFDNKIYVYGVNDGYSLSCIIGQHNAYITHIDFSEDSAWLQSNCAGFELCFFESDTGMYIPAASRLRDVRWSTQTCTLGWAVQGIWGPQRDGTEITACDANLFRGEDGTIIATGDNYGRVQLYRYPSTSSTAVSKMYRPASNQITRVKFVAGDSYLVTISGPDKSIVRWRHNRDRGENVAHDLLLRAGKIDEEEEDVIQFFGLESASEALGGNKELQNSITSRPWIASIVAPSDVSVVNTLNETEPPRVKVEIAHIFGLQCDTSRASVKYNFQGDIVYPTSKYVCIYSKKSNMQTYYQGHESTISCLSLSLDGKLVASSEKNKRACIHVWDASTCELLKILPVLHRRGVASIQFSKDRRSIVSVGQDRDHSVAVWESLSGEWVDGRLRAWNKGDINPVLFASFYGTDNFLFASGGRFHIKFWQINGSTINSFCPEYEISVKLGTLLCGASLDREFVSGSVSGHLQVWVGRKLDRVIRAHEKGVSSIWCNDVNVVTSSKDGNVKVWTSKLEFIKGFDLADADIPPLHGCIRSVDVTTSKQQKDQSLTRVLVATAGGDIYEVAVQSGSICLIHESHYRGELWGVSAHPTDPDLFVTTGDDNTVRVWNISHKRVLRKAVLDCTSRCANWSPDGRLIIVGLGGSWDGKRQRKDGAFLVLDANTLKPLFEGRYK